MGEYGFPIRASLSSYREEAERQRGQRGSLSPKEMVRQWL